MNARQTFLWLLTAAVLFAFIYFFQQHRHPLPTGPARILANFDPAAVTSVQVRPAGPIQLQIRAERTNHAWQLIEPLTYPAQATNIEAMLSALQTLTPATYITGAEMRSHPNADEDYGFSSTQACSVIIFQPDHRIQLLLGARTAPGDQVFLQDVGVEGAYVVDAELLNRIPRTVNDWRDTTVVNPAGLAFDWLAVTNKSKAFVLQRDLTNRLWRLVWPPSLARADNARIEDSLQRLQALGIHQFISDDPKADLESFGLATPELELSLGQGTNAFVRLQFGASPTNQPGQVYAHRVGQNTIFTVSRNLLDPWRGASANDFRDPHLLVLTEPVQRIEVRGQDNFSLQHQTNDTWRILPENLPADDALVKKLLDTLSGLEIVQFTKDVVNPPDLPAYGLAPPVRQYVLQAASTNGAASVTNVVLADLHFGTNQEDRIFARRTDESSVYAVKLADFQRLPAAGWLLRDRKVWPFSIDDVARVTIQQQGKTRQMVRKGPHAWSLAPGSQGIINDLAVEETVRGLVQVSAAEWVARGQQNRARYGFTDTGHQIIVELKSGDTHTIEFGGEAPSKFPYAAVTLDGQLWIFEFPWALYRDVVTYLSVP